jgi:hypothetical protein
MKNRKNKILIGLLKLSIASLLISGCALDSKSNIPLIICGVSLLYITLFIVANTRG